MRPAFVVACLAVCGFASPAVAETVTATGSTITIDATESGLASDITVTAAGTVYTVSDASVSVSAGSGCTQAGASATCDVSGPVTVSGSLGNSNDVIHTSSLGATVSTNVDGGPGNDQLFSGAGNDLLIGSANNDTLNGGGGSDTYEGDAGDDTFIGTAGDETVTYANEPAVTANLTTGTASTGGDTDTFTQTAGPIDSVIGSSFVDNITGNAADNRLFGENGADTINGAAGSDVIEGGAGDDILNGGANPAAGDIVSYSGASGVTVNLGTGTATGDGTDTLTGFEDILGSFAANDTLIGDSGPNVINGLTGTDTYEGRAGNDTFIATVGGNETVSYANEPAVNASLAAGTATTSGGTDTFDTTSNPGSHIESLVGSAFDDTLAGENAAVVNTLDGGGGSDTVSYAASTTRVIVDLVADTGDKVNPGGVIDNLPRIENVTGSDVVAGGGDHITGDSGPNRIQGLAGSDTILGGDGADVLDGGADNDLVQGQNDNDTLIGSGTSDQLNGGAGTDTVSYASAPDVVIATMSSTGTNGSAAITGGGSDTMTFVENFIGSSNNDIITGDGAANNIEAGPGRDFVQGEGGDDVLNGGDGDDVASFQGASSVVASLLTGTATGNGNDTLTGFERLTGSPGNDTLTGDSGDNTLSGVAGNDTLIGRGGTDQLFGGNGTDTASYATAAGGVTATLASPAGASADGDGGTDSFSTIEQLTGSNNADDLTGTAGADVISGLGGDDLIHLRDGGPDTVDCGDGNDHAIIDATETAVTACELADDPSPTPTPAITGSTPAPGTNDNAPRLIGTASAASTVNLFNTADCSGNALTSGPAATFASPGLPVAVGDNTATVFYAKAASADVDGPSGCSGAFTYTEVTPAPAPAPGPTPAADTTPPQTRLVKPLKSTHDRTPTFRFSSSEAGSTFQCRVDKGKFASCRSPHTLKRLKFGRHTLSVRARDAAGNVDPTPATAKFTIKRRNKH